MTVEKVMTNEEESLSMESSKGIGGGVRLGGDPCGRRKNLSSQGLKTQSRQLVLTRE